MDSERIKRVLEEWTPRILSIMDEEAGSIVDGKWTRRQILGHLIDSGINNYHRFAVLSFGALTGFPGYDQERWVEAGAYESSRLTDLTALWLSLNRQIAALIDHAPPGAESNMWVDKNLSFDFLYGEYVSHMLRHLPEIVYGSIESRPSDAAIRVPAIT